MLVAAAGDAIVPGMIVPPSSLFQFQLPVRCLEKTPSATAFRLSGEMSVFVPSALQSGSAPFELRIGWHEDGLAISVRVTGKRISPAGTSRDWKSSDHLRLSVDTRHTVNVRRATEYCSAVLVLPVDDDNGGEPLLTFTDIGQQRTQKHDRISRRCFAKTELQKDGYWVDLWIPAGQLPGFADIAGIGVIGFYVVVNDTELGELPLSVGDDFPIAHDPATWLQLQLVGAGG